MERGDLIAYIVSTPHPENEECYRAVLEVEGVLLAKGRPGMGLEPHLLLLPLSTRALLSSLCSRSSGCHLDALGAPGPSHRGQRDSHMPDKAPAMFSGWKIVTSPAPSFATASIVWVTDP